VFAAGRAELLARLAAGPVVTVVGTRRPSPYGSEMAYTLGRGLAAAGVHVVSGLAFGIDAAAHRGCLEGRAGRAVAVVAGGPDVAYPRRHRRLFERVRQDGVVVSEMPPGCRPFRWSFPARNRLMAALGDVTVVVEAADPSGSLITAEFAQDIGRTVGAVPGRATAWTAAGTNGLLRDGAAVIRSPQDVLDELFGPGVRVLPPTLPPAPEDPVLKRVLSALEHGDGVGAVASATGLSAAETRSALARLEIEGYLTRDPFGGYRGRPG
jgi:DNA processing protein